MREASRKHLAVRLEELDARETTYVRLVGKPGWPEDKIMGELADIQRQRGRFKISCGTPAASWPPVGSSSSRPWELLKDLRAFYTRCGTSLKKAMNKVIFDKLHMVNGEITGQQFTETARAVVEAEPKGPDVLPARQRAGAEA